MFNSDLPKIIGTRNICFYCSTVLFVNAQNYKIRVPTYIIKIYWKKDPPMNVSICLICKILVTILAWKARLETWLRSAVQHLEYKGFK